MMALHRKNGYPVWHRLTALMTPAATVVQWVPAAGRDLRTAWQCCSPLQGPVRQPGPTGTDGLARGSVRWAISMDMGGLQHAGDDWFSILCRSYASLWRNSRVLRTHNCDARVGGNGGHGYHASDGALRESCSLHGRWLCACQPPPGHMRGSDHRSCESCGRPTRSLSGVLARDRAHRRSFSRNQTPLRLSGN